ncbi:hypothetical protein BH09BAC2_BH09BAC2_07220 [soil metagenome]
MLSFPFSYEKSKVIQALRYHFITRNEIRLMIILVNVFAIVSAALFFFQKVSPFAFLISSVLWFILMISFWFVLPYTVYKKAATFRDHFTVTFKEDFLMLENERGSNSWKWEKFSKLIESPHFFHLYFNNRTFFLIPKITTGAVQVNDVRQFLKLKIVN